ncbi:MAG: DUF1559 domain-containing protein, partial [Gemmataceae bacterium]
EHALIQSKTIPLFLCPTETVRQSTISAHDEWGTSSFVGVSGTHVFVPNGMLFAGSGVTPSQVRDGLSSTLIFGERPPSRTGLQSSWYTTAGATTCAVGNILPAGRYAVPLPRGCRLDIPSLTPPTDPEDDCSQAHFWSLHPNGANFAFADGSVRFLTFGVSAILPALATRAGGETVAVPD